MLASCFELRLDTLKKLCQAGAMLRDKQLYVAAPGVEVANSQASGIGQL